MIYFITVFLYSIPAFFMWFFWYRRLPKRLYGMFGYVGLAGEGKTYSMVREAIRLYDAWEGKIYILSNVEIRHPKTHKIITHELKSTAQLTLSYGMPCLALIDELPSIWNARNWAKFPPEMLSKITQLRKGDGMRILYTAQRFFMIDKEIRAITNSITSCRCLFGCLFTHRTASAQDIDPETGVISFGKEKSTDVFYMRPKIYNCYDTLASCIAFV